MTKKKRELGNETYYYSYNSDIKLLKDPVKKILFPKLKHWIHLNEENETIRHLHDGYFWTYGSYEFWAKECNLKPKTVGDHLRELVKSGLLISGNYNKLKIDKTIWYRLPTEDELKNVDFVSLYYGSSKRKKGIILDNKMLYTMYKNGMTIDTKTGFQKEETLVTIPEQTTEHYSEEKIEYNLEEITDNNSDSNLNNPVDETNSSVNKLDKKYCYNELNLILPNGWYDYLIYNGVENTLIKHIDILDHYSDDRLDVIAKLLIRILE